MTFKEVPSTKNSLDRRRSIYGVGVNDAAYEISINVNGKKYFCPFYIVWTGMMKRCYSTTFKNKHLTYSECSTSKEWLSFSKFKSWMIKQDWKEKELDKDILIQGNKLYSPETCLFVSKQINTLLRERKANRGCLPIGVTKVNKTYVSRCNKNGIKIYLGSFSTSEEAYNTYKKYKLSLIKEIALTQDEPIRSALLKFEIEPITQTQGINND